MSKGLHPKDARRMFQEQVDYWEGRMSLGDPLFDQWMVDAYEAARDGLRVMDRLQEAGVRTGIRAAAREHDVRVAKRGPSKW